MAQIARTGKFRLFDWGNSKANMEAYGTPQPPDIVERYGSLGEWSRGAKGIRAAQGDERVGSFMDRQEHATKHAAVWVLLRGKQTGRTSLIQQEGIGLRHRTI
eukprot:1161796-Pelagomonas_calceolata.AAC.3